MARSAAVPVGDGRAERHHHGVRHTHHLAPRRQNRRDGQPIRLVHRRQAYAGRPGDHSRSDPDHRKNTPNSRPHRSDSF